MDSYIVRIYRRDHEAPEVIAGIVELIANQKVMPFRSSKELVKILTMARGSVNENHQPASQRNIDYL